MEALERMNRLYFANDDKSAAEKNRLLVKELEKLVERTLSHPLQTQHAGEWMLHVYVTKMGYAEHLALVKGTPDTSKPVLVRMHAQSYVIAQVCSRGAKRGHRHAVAMAHW